jgi:hypothetical protein
MEWKPLRVRLRPGKDDDIGKALQNLSGSEDKSDVVRAALRYYLLGRENERTNLRALSKENLDEVELTKTKIDGTELEGAIDDLFNGF